MSNSEKRVIKSMLLAGAVVVAIGLMAVYLGWSRWWFEKTHLLGSFGIEMMVYGLCHAGFYWYETQQTFKNNSEDE